MKRLISAAAGACLMITGSMVHASDETLYQKELISEKNPEDTVVDNGIELNKLNKYTNINQFPKEYYNSSNLYKELLDLQKVPLKGEFEKTVDYNDRVNFDNRYLKIKYNYGRQFIFNNDLGKFFQNNIYNMKYNADTEMMKVKINGVFFEVGDALLNNGNFGSYSNKPIGVKCEIDENISMKPDFAEKIKNSYDYATAISFIVRYEPYRAIELSGRDTINGKPSNRLFRDRLEVFPGYYKRTQSFFGGGIPEFTAQFFYPNWESAIIFIYNKFNGEIFIQKKCDTGHF